MVSPDQFVAVEVVEDPTFSVGRRSVLFSAADFLAGPTHAIYDLRSDGEAFVMIRTAVPPRPSELILVQNFEHELRTSVSTR